MRQALGWRRRAAGWRGIGERSRRFFLLVSMDEPLSLHERLSGLLCGSSQTSGYYFAWIIHAAVFLRSRSDAGAPFHPKLSTQGAPDAYRFAGDLPGWGPGHGDGGLQNLEGLGVLLLLYAVALYRRERFAPVSAPRRHALRR